MTTPIEPAQAPAIGTQSGADEAHTITRPPQDRQAARSKYAAAGGWALLLVCTACLFIYSLPALPGESWSVLKKFPPRSLDMLEAQRDVLLQYARRSPVRLAAALGSVYVLMQTFAIPGTLWLSLLCGALYGVGPGITLVSVLNLCGSLSCYTMSWMVGRTLVQALYPQELAKYANEVHRRRAALFNYIVILRATPVLPNVFINVASPIVDVPVAPFALGTLVGCLPNNFVAVNAGSRLGDMHQLSDLYDFKMLLIGCGVGFLAMLPLIWEYLPFVSKTQTADPLTRQSLIHGPEHVQS